MEKIQVRIRKLDERAKMPVYSSEYAAGMDLYAFVDGSVMIAPGETVMIHTKLAAEIPAGYAGLIYARSGMAVKKGLAPANKVGVVDADYRGEIMVALYNHSPEDRFVEDGDRIAQMGFFPVARAVFSESDELGETERGEGGFGHSGIR